MPSQKELRTRIDSVNAVKQMTKTMKMISIAKYGTISKKQKEAVVYASMLDDIKSKFISNHEEHVRQQDIDTTRKDLLIVISSDKGFCGNFNNNIFKKTLAFLNEANINNVDIFPIGKKINDFLTKRGVKTHTDYVNILKKVDINTIGEAVVNLTLKSEYNKIFIIYNHFISFSKSVPSIISLDAKLISLPVNNDIEKQFIFEPGYNDFFYRLYMMDVQTQIVKALFESCVAEHSARMFNMSKATDNAEVLLKKLRILYNQMRQASITNEIIEISAGYKNT